MHNPGGGLLALLLASSAALGGTLTASLEDGTEIASLPVPDGAGWCVLWRHSVQGFDVTDCYENRAGAMVLVRSHWPDAAAGLDHIPGRGRQVSDGKGGYWILDIDEPVPGNAYILRPGAMSVDHRLSADAGVVSLSALAARARVTIALEEETDG